MTLPGARRQRWTSLVAALALAMTVTLLPSAPESAHADAGTEAAFVAATNAARSAAGLQPLAVSDDLTAVARSHSAVMADAVHLHHNPDLGGDVGGWQKVGENVGRGPSVANIQDAFMASPSHHRNIVDGEWTQIGIGADVRDGHIWVTVLFRQPTGETPEPEAEPEPAPETAEEPTDPDGPANAATAETADAATESSDEPAPDAPAGGPADAPAPAADAPPDVPAGDRISVTMAKLEASEGWAGPGAAAR